MRLELSEAISLILALPAHRSHDEGHRLLGTKTLDYLMEYKELGSDDVEKAFNRSMIASVLSTVRAFSVQRDAINATWKTIDAIKAEKKSLSQEIRDISPLSKGNASVKQILAIIGALGISIRALLPTQKEITFLIYLIAVFFILEIGTIIAACLINLASERNDDKYKQKSWEDNNLTKYKEIIGKFIDEVIQNYKTYYPNTKDICGYAIANSDQVQIMKEEMINIHFYL